MKRQPAGKKGYAGAAELESIAQLWRWMTVAAFIYTLGLWIRTQTDAIEPLKVIASTTANAVVLGLFASPLLLVILWLAARYARLTSHLPRWERVPAIRESGMSGSTGTLFRGVLGIGAMTIMVASQVHFVFALLSGTVVRQITGKPPEQLAAGWRAMLTVPPSAGTAWLLNDYRFGVDGPTYFPVLESWLWLLLVFSLVLAFATYLFGYLRITRA